MAKFHRSGIRSLHREGFDRTSSPASIKIARFEPEQQDAFGFLFGNKLNPQKVAREVAKKKRQKAKSRLQRRRQHNKNVQEREKLALRIILGDLADASLKKESLVGKELIRQVAKITRLSEERVRKVLNKLTLAEFVRRVGKTFKRVCLVLNKKSFHDTVKEAEQILFGNYQTAH